MQYALVMTTDGQQLYQELQHGAIVRYCDLDGNTVPEPLQGGAVVDLNPPQPSWARPDIPPTTVVTNIVTRSEFRNKFTMTEKIALYTLAKQQVEVQILLDDVTNSDQIDLAAADTREKLMLLVPTGILTVDRVNEILAA
jgi:hypothetical protein